MLERKIIYPKDVAEYYHEFQDQKGSFITLMGCYPIGSNAQRIMVVAKKSITKMQTHKLLTKIYQHKRKSA